jgi:hypothetical protein
MLVLQGQLEFKGILAPQELQVCREAQAQLVSAQAAQRVLLVFLDQKVLLARLALLAMSARQAQLEPQESMVLRGQLAYLELTERQAQLARLAYKVMSELLVLLAQRD